MKTNKIEKYLLKINKEAFKDKRDEFKTNANKIIDKSEEVCIVLSEKSIESLGMPPLVIGLLLTALEEISETEFNKDWIIENVELLLERLKNE